MVVIKLDCDMNFLPEKKHLAKATSNLWGQAMVEAGEVAGVFFQVVVALAALAVGPLSQARRFVKVQNWTKPKPNLHLENFPYGKGSVVISRRVWTLLPTTAIHPR